LCRGIFARYAETEFTKNENNSLASGFCKDKDGKIN
jgi:hypothetical protein